MYVAGGNGDVAESVVRWPVVADDGILTLIARYECQSGSDGTR